MITFLKAEEYAHNRAGEYAKGAQLVEIACGYADLDDIPFSGIVTGSMMFVVDTGKLYCFGWNGTQGAWINVNDNTDYIIEESENTDPNAN